MRVKLDSDLLEKKLDRMKMNFQQMMIDAKKTGLEAEEKKRSLLSGLHSSLGAAEAYLEKLKGATAEQVEDVEEALKTVWDELERKYEQATKVPSD